MDDARSAHLPLATDFHLRGIEADGVLYHVAGRWVKGPAEERGWSLTLGRKGLSGLPHHTTLARSGFAEGWSIYPPSFIGAPGKVLLLNMVDNSTSSLRTHMEPVCCYFAV